MLCVTGECRDVSGSKNTSSLFRSKSAVYTEVEQSQEIPNASSNGSVSCNELLCQKASLSNSLSRLTTDSPNFHRTWSGSSLHPEGLLENGTAPKANQATNKVCHCCQTLAASGYSSECAGTKCSDSKLRKLAAPLGWKRLRRLSKPLGKNSKRFDSSCTDYNSNHSPAKELVEKGQIHRPEIVEQDQSEGLDIMSQSIPNVNRDKRQRMKVDRIEGNLTNGAREVYDKQFQYCAPIKPHHRMSRLIHVDGVSYKVTMESPGQRRNSANSVLEHIPSKALNQAATTIVGGTVYSRPPGNGREPLTNMAITAVRHPSAENNSLDSIAWTNERNALASTVNLRQREGMFDPKNVAAMDHAALRLRGILTTVASGNLLSLDVLRRNLDYAISVLESRHLASVETPDESSFEEEMSSNVSGETTVPPEIKRWLLQTFSNAATDIRRKRDKEKRSLRSVVHAVQAGMFVDRIFRKHSEAAYQLPPVVEEKLKGIDRWTFNVFDLEEVSEGHSLKYVFYQLLNKYNFLHKFKIRTKSLFSYCHRLEQGYRKHDNRYHNPMHAADVAQTLHCLLANSGLTHWLSDIEMFAMITAAVVHDVEHTGTTNTFHMNTRSELAQLYNDRSILENHHVSTAFRIMQDEDCDILRNLEKEDYQECRALIIDMVLATDMSQHFGQIQRLKAAVQHPECLEKSKAMCLMIHAADVNHPTKPWHLHYRWTERLVFEFFEQGDKERELFLPVSPLCDRETTLVAQSQIGFIDYVIEPTFSLLYEIFRQVNNLVMGAAPSKRCSVGASESSANDGRPSLAPGDVLKRRFSDAGCYVPSLSNRSTVSRTLSNASKECFMYMAHNRRQWQRKDAIEQENQLFGEEAFTKAPAFAVEPLPLPAVPLENGSDQTRKGPGMRSSTERTIDASEPP